MAIIPKCLSERQIENFVNNVNQTADEILGESKFEIPNPALPGIGLLIKLQMDPICSLGICWEVELCLEKTR